MSSKKYIGEQVWVCFASGHGKARQGKARQGKARQGMAWDRMA
jgi:hypothetical protein